MRYCFVLLCMLVLAGCACAVQAQAQGTAQPAAASAVNPPDGMAMVDSCVRLHTELELTGDQLRRIRSIQLDAAKRAIPIAAEIQVHQVELMQLLMEDKADMNQIDAVVRRIGVLNGDLYLVGIRALIAVRDVLTPEQRNRIESMMLRGQLQKGGSSGCACPCCKGMPAAAH